MKNLIKACSHLGYSIVELIDAYDLSDEEVNAMDWFEAECLVDHYDGLRAQF